MNQAAQVGFDVGLLICCGACIHAQHSISLCCSGVSVAVPLPCPDCSVLIGIISFSWARHEPLAMCLQSRACEQAVCMLCACRSIHTPGS